jgi:hypothetical protein
VGLRLAWLAGSLSLPTWMSSTEYRFHPIQTSFRKSLSLLVPSFSLGTHSMTIP